ncbi:hypothetical protein SeLEV6574_g06671 [Synchytrium endobioticum]|uniref:Uncharacterized protein n=1 Tax=Synchytrium endobioticum TaxID=286115 RepID=A0A507CMX2_9FUNG|nr:hypothetical protein SeLEV6574_g06671 [Synchytrium endobioticum]
MRPPPPYFLLLTTVAHLTLAKHEIQINPQEPLPTPYRKTPWPPLRSDGTVQTTCIQDGRTAGSTNPYYHCPGDWVTIDLLHEEDWSPLRLKVASKVKCQQYVDKSCYLGIWASWEEVSDWMKFQIFPTRYDPKTGIWGFLLKDHLGRWVLSTTKGPLAYHETHRRDVLLVNSNQEQTAHNGSAMEFELIPTGRQSKDYWWRASRDGCYWQQHAQSYADDENADAYHQAFVCGWDELFTHFDQVQKGANNGVWLSATDPPAGVLAPYTQEISAYGSDRSKGQTTDVLPPQLSSATIVNFGPTTPRTQISVSATFENTISSHIDTSFGLGTQVGASYGFGGQQIGGFGVGLTLGFDTTKSKSTQIQTSNTTTQAVELWVYTENMSAQKAMTVLTQKSYTNIPYWYTLKRKWTDGTVMLLNITGRFNIQFAQSSKSCTGYTVDMSLADLKQIAINQPLCRMAQEGISMKTVMVNQNETATQTAKATQTPVVK